MSEPETWSLEEIARIFRRSVPTVRTWVQQGCPVYKRGGNGVAYQFDVQAVRAWVQQQDAAAEQAKLARNERELELFSEILGDGALSLNPEARALSIREQRDALGAEVAATNLARQRGELVPFADVVIERTRAYRRIQERLLALPDHLQRQFGLDEDITRALHVAIGDALEDLSRDLGQSSDAARAA